MKGRRTSPAILALEAEAAGLRRAGEERLIRIAAQLNFFEAVVPNAALVEALSAAMLRQPRDPARPPKVSLNKLGKLNDRIRMARTRQTREERARDARRKILLGSFLISEFEYDPVFLARMRSKLSDFLDLHRDPNVRAGNRELLADWLTKETPGE